MASEDLRINQRLTIPGSEIVERFTAAGGSGGQHVNKVSTRVELIFDIGSSSTLSEAQRERLSAVFGPRVRVVVAEERSQFRNRVIARQRLADRLREALAPRRSRRPTAPTRGSRVRRLDAKKQRGQLKKDRRRPSW